MFRERIENLVGIGEEIKWSSIWCTCIGLLYIVNVKWYILWLPRNSFDANQYWSNPAFHSAAGAGFQEGVWKHFKQRGNNYPMSFKQLFLKIVYNCLAETGAYKIFNYPMSLRSHKMERVLILRNYPIRNFPFRYRGRKKYPK